MNQNLLSVKSKYLLSVIVLCLYAATTNGQETVRLVGGSSNREGRVEVYYNGEWGTVCDDEWDVNDGNVVCRQLGLGGAIMAPGEASYGRGNGSILLSELGCSGNEALLTDCVYTGWNNTNCDHIEDAGVQCKDISTPPLPDDGDLRLADGRNQFEGRVEIFFDDSWGTVCSDNWNYQDALVICRQLGFGDVDSNTVTFGAGYGPIMGTITCTGSEPALEFCSLSLWDTDKCQHTQDVGLRCLPPDVVDQTVEPTSEAAQETSMKVIQRTVRRPATPFQSTISNQVNEEINFPVIAVVVPLVVIVLIIICVVIVVACYFRLSLTLSGLWKRNSRIVETQSTDVYHVSGPPVQTQNVQFNHRSSQNENEAVNMMVGSFPSPVHAEHQEHPVTVAGRPITHSSKGRYV